MASFQRKALIAFLILLALSLVLGAAGYRRSFLEAALVPTPDQQAPWRIQPGADASPGGRSETRMLDDGRRLRVQLHVAGTASTPYAEANLFFVDRAGKPVHADLSRYSSVSFVATCAPGNTLSLVAPTFEPTVSRRGDLLTYRAPTAFFACSEHGTRVDLDLTRLETPQWWFAMFGLDLAWREYRLDQVPKLAIGSSFQSPRDTDLLVDISGLALHGRDLRWIVVPGSVLLLAWAGFGFWFFRRHAAELTRDVQDRLQKDLPIVAYQQLSLQPHRDREKATILRVIATRYADAELDLESVVNETGVNRNKVNEILKAELGFTFSGYLNKLRLTEAARLLADKGSATVSEIAYSVGYNNVSYFNKLFKEEYGCTPKAFRGALGATDEVAPASTSVTKTSTIRMEQQLQP
ncbi:helix-turn-helix transcriptional regulator [Massilia sp.]|uniref:helix-turn-helix domain-containing protein n=1 Tax=Massilia sp. TaxID=1882437 RepID=UPI00289D83ED|nr:helix-turn-helix transcriptional regulator [Massilia sp.]